MSEHLGLSIDIWDIERESAISPSWNATPPWLEKNHKTLIFTFNHPKDLSQLCPKHLIDFLLGIDWDKQYFLPTTWEFSHPLSSSSSPFVLFLNTTSISVATAIFSTSQHIYHYLPDQFHSIQLPKVWSSPPTSEKFLQSAKDLSIVLTNQLQYKDPLSNYSVIYIDLPPVCLPFFYILLFC